MKIINKSRTNKQYSYQIKDITLNFMLNYDSVEDLKCFKALLEIALKEVTEDITKIKQNDK